MRPIRGQAELTRYAVVDGDARQTELIPVDLAAIRRGDAGADLQLKPYDTLVIKPIPMWMEPGTIEVAGEVRFPGKYPIHQGETLHSVLVRAGGFTDVAFPGGRGIHPRGAEEAREGSARLAGQPPAERSGGAVARGGREQRASPTPAAAARAPAKVWWSGSNCSRSCAIPSRSGRLVINIDGVYKGRPGGPDDVLVKDGDKLLVPKKTQEITILGEVQSPTSHVYEPGLTRDDYIAKSGGTTQKADRKRIYVVRANGDVVSRRPPRMVQAHRSRSRCSPGDTIVVPLDTQNGASAAAVAGRHHHHLQPGDRFVLIHAYL